VKYHQFVYSGDAALLELLYPLDLSAAYIETTKIVGDGTLNTSSTDCMTVTWSRGGYNSKQTTLKYLKLTVFFVADVPALTFSPIQLVSAEICNSTEHYNQRLPSTAVQCAEDANQNCNVSEFLTKRSILKSDNYHSKLPKNDDGAPLICNGTLQGLLSHRTHCGQRAHPKIYSTISPDLSDWIRNTIGNGRIFS
jgi:hypothetical protein